MDFLKSVLLITKIEFSNNFQISDIKTLKRKQTRHQYNKIVLY